MKYLAFSIFDAKAVAFSQPFYASNNAVAIRMYAQVVNDPGSVVSKNPEDFTLFGVGEFDDASGEFSPFPSEARAIVNGAALRQPVLALAGQQPLLEESPNA